MYTPLRFDHAITWYEKLWEREEYFYFSRPPMQPDSIHAAYLNSYLRSSFTIHALRLLNLEGELEDDTEAHLIRDIRNHAIAAGRHVGVRFAPGKSNYWLTMEGELSSEWLAQTAKEVAEFAIEVWDPEVAKRRHEQAVRGGKMSHLNLTPEHLIPLAEKSKSIQAKALGCSVGKVAQLRRELRAMQP